jgi:RNA polymerase sigma-70 factor (ECF subfamily)
MSEQTEFMGTDRDLVRAILERGDERAFRSLYRRHTHRLFGFVSRLLAGSGFEDEDIVQETWLRACEQLKQFQWRASFSTWLLAIGLNAVRDELRRRGRSQAVPLDCVPDPPGPRMTYDAGIDLERAIRMLPDDYRIVLVLHDVEGIKHHEISQRLEIPIGTTKSQLSRARGMIRQWLSEKAR